MSFCLFALLSFCSFVFCLFVFKCLYQMKIQSSHDNLQYDGCRNDVLLSFCLFVFYFLFLGQRGPLIEPSSVHPSATIFPEFIDELKHCRQASGTPQIIYFLKDDDVSYHNTNTNANTETNTKTETKKGRALDTYGVIYF